jgi:hypothetical protein
MIYFEDSLFDFVLLATHLENAFFLPPHWSQDSAVGVVAGYGLDN